MKFQRFKISEIKQFQQDSIFTSYLLKRNIKRIIIFFNKHTLRLRFSLLWTNNYKKGERSIKEMKLNKSNRNKKNRKYQRIFMSKSFLTNPKKRKRKGRVEEEQEFKEQKGEKE